MKRSSENRKYGFQTTFDVFGNYMFPLYNRGFSIQYSGLNLNQDKATKPQTVQIVRQGEATPYWFKVNPL
ncbi:transposase [Neisseria macacae ATCC 33926]|uniref:Uncharacterized protein n=2 Tax=Neisseria TaxID=482 RepID=I2NXC7_NEISI|nr:transposase [Neisseria macacae ATCC 33926]EIG30488.1 hypothetical protein HMPREF1051_3069 [Neisseria sicca VK64]